MVTHWLLGSQCFRHMKISEDKIHLVVPYTNPRASQFEWVHWLAHRWALKKKVVTTLNAFELTKPIGAYKFQPYWNCGLDVSLYYNESALWILDHCKGMVTWLDFDSISSMEKNGIFVNSMTSINFAAVLWYLLRLTHWSIFSSISGRSHPQNQRGCSIEYIQSNGAKWPLPC